MLQLNFYSQRNGKNNRFKKNNSIKQFQYAKNMTRQLKLYWS